MTVHLCVVSLMTGIVGAAGIACAIQLQWWWYAIGLTVGVAGFIYALRKATRQLKAEGRDDGT